MAVTSVKARNLTLGDLPIGEAGLVLAAGEEAELLGPMTIAEIAGSRGLSGMTQKGVLLLTILRDDGTSTIVSAALDILADELDVESTDGGSGLSFIIDGPNESTIQGRIAVNTAAGQYAAAFGNSTTASGESSHAEGKSTNPGVTGLASGIGAHAEGADCIASADFAHAEGCGTVASAACAHAEGLLVQATGFFSHAEGQSTSPGTLGVASGTGAHVSGFNCVASGNYAHAEGVGTTASGAGTSGAHSEGLATTASGIGSHAEGGSTNASGARAHAEGLQTHATGSNAHAEGESGNPGVTGLASGTASHCEGFDTVASGHRSHSEGNSTTASGDQSHAEGNGSQATADSAHAEGSGTTAAGQFSHSGGADSKAEGAYSFAHGRKAETDVLDGTVIFTDSQDFKTKNDSANQVKLRFTNGLKLVAGGGSDYNDGLILFDVDSVGLGQFNSGVKVKATGTGSTTLSSYHEAIEQNLGTLTWTATTAPSGTINKKYKWSRIGNIVTVLLKIDASIAGTAVTAVEFEMPSDMPSPAVFASQPVSTIVAVGSGKLASSANPTIGGAEGSKLYKNGSGTYVIAVEATVAVTGTFTWGSLTYLA